MESANSTPPAPVQSASVWEDFLDIFYAPSRVFARRANGNFWIPLLLVTLLIATLVFANRNVMRPVYDAEFSRSVAQLMKANPALTASQLDTAKARGFVIAEYGAVVVIPITILVVAFITWFGAKFVDAKLTWNSALVIVSYATVPKVIQQVYISLEGLLLDPASFTSRFAIELGPARFMDPSSITPLAGAFFDRLDVFILWGLALIAIGVATVGKLSKPRAWGFGIGLWIVTLLPSLLQALQQR